MPDVYNYLSSTARTVMPKTYIPEQCFSLVVTYFNGDIDKIMFQLPPEQITEFKGANYAADHVLGRFEPIRMYTNSDATKINFTVNYYWLEDSLSNTSVGTWQGIREQVLKLRALLYPYDDGRSSTAGNTTQSSPANANTNPQSTDTSAQDVNAYNNYVGKLTPPPQIKLYYGDLYNGLPCILSGIQIDFKGPWNDASLAAVSRRLAANTATASSSGLTQAANSAQQVLNPIADIVQSLPQNILGSRASLLNVLTSSLRQDKMFPFVTTVNITLESAYKFGVQQTYNDITNLIGKNVPLLSKVINNLPIFR